MDLANRSSELIKDVSLLVWGVNIRPELFSRWSQGFIFSHEEKTALIQTSGGPCAVIAPVQAFLVKNLTWLYSIDQFKELDEAVIDQVLAASLTEMMCQCQIYNKLTDKNSANLLNDSKSIEEDIQGPFVIACLDDPLPTSNPGMSPEEQEAPQCHNRDLFHSSIRLKQLDSKDNLQNFFETNLEKFKLDFGILLFLYSVILTKGLSRIREEMCDPESLIDQTEGHGGQALINLLITGRASSYVWDGAKDVGGLSLVGVVRRPSVGFLTRLEYLHYVSVGWYLKNPKSAVWVLGSETHLTVLFSWCENLITPDNEVEKAKQVFSWYDTEGNNFIPRDKLQPLLKDLNLCTDPEFIELMMSELDPENMGVILFHKFIGTFFQEDQSYKPPDTFTIHHYNGLEHSCPDNKIQYATGIATRQESHVDYAPRNSDILTALNAKWPNIDVSWNTFQPSLN